MTSEEREQLIAIIEKRAKEIRCARAETRTVDGDVMANFKRYDWRGILVFLEDKLGRITASAQSSGSVEEFAEDALDMRNYIDFLLIRSGGVQTISEMMGRGETDEA